MYNHDTTTIKVLNISIARKCLLMLLGSPLLAPPPWTTTHLLFAPLDQFVVLCLRNHTRKFGFLRSWSSFIYIISSNYYVDSSITKKLIFREAKSQGHPAKQWQHGSQSPGFPHCRAQPGWDTLTACSPWSATSPWHESKGRGWAQVSWVWRLESWPKDLKTSPLSPTTVYMWRILVPGRTDIGGPKFCKIFIREGPWKPRLVETEGSVREWGRW